jgi:hypothetical protein
MLRKIFTNVKFCNKFQNLNKFNAFKFAEGTGKDNKNKKQKEAKEIKDQAKEPKSENKKDTKLTTENKENKLPQKSFDKENYKISHNYNTKKVTQEQKQLLENIVTQFLRQERISSEESEKMKKSLRDPLHDTIIPEMEKISQPSDLETICKDDATLSWYFKSLKPYLALIRDQREQRDHLDPNYIKIRSLNTLMRDKDMTFTRPKNTDVRQNVNSPDFMKRQPRLNVNYSYNYEEHREFTWTYNKAVEADNEKQLYQQKLIKYIKSYPDRPEVKSRFMKQISVPVDHLPDYDVDISDFKPPITKKSRRKYDKPKYDIDIKDYQCWRTLDRDKLFFSPKQAYLTVMLIPKNLIAVKCINFSYMDHLRMAFMMILLEHLILKMRT